MESLSIVVPVYHSEPTLDELCRRITHALQGLALPYELILVDDGSRDRSWEKIQSQAAGNPAIRGLRLTRNFGQHNALLCGIREARHEVIVTLDDDLQHPPEEIGKLLEKLKEGYDLVYGTPAAGVHGAARVLAAKVTKWTLRSAMKVPAAPSASAFRAFRASLKEGFAECRNPLFSLDVLLAWCSDSFASVEVRCDSRKVGKSNYGFQKLLAHTFNMVTGYSVLPLQLASWIGFFFTLFGMAILAYVLFRYLLQGTSVPGFSFLASIIAIFSGAQLFALGMVGEYLSRMYFRVMDRPSYLVRTDTDSAKRFS
jgi:glycosyltransferase involved in cell wall biosynthesis